MLVPININLKNKKVLIIGGGKVALNKIRYFNEFKACITVVSPEYGDETDEFIKSNNIENKNREFKVQDLIGMNLVIIATNDKKTNSFITKECEDLGILFNNCSKNSESDFSVPAVVKRGDLVITVSTNGKSPALSRQIKGEISNSYNIDYKQIIELLGILRKEVLAKENDSKRKQEILRGAAKLGLEDLKKYIDEYKGERR